MYNPYKLTKCLRMSRTSLGLPYAPTKRKRNHDIFIVVIMIIFSCIINQDQLLFFDICGNQKLTTICNLMISKFDFMQAVIPGVQIIGGYGRSSDYRRFQGLYTNVIKTLLISNHCKKMAIDVLCNTEPPDSPDEDSNEMKTLLRTRKKSLKS